MFNFDLNVIPGANLVRQAWDATKLAGALIQKKKERALVLATERRTEVERFAGKKANKRLKELVDKEEYGEVARLFVPDSAIDFAKEAADVYFRIWDIYWIFVILYEIFFA